MIAFLLKDFYALRTYILRQIGLMVVIYTVIAFGLRSFSILPSMFTLTTMTMLISSFSADEVAHWDSFALTLPVNARDIVRAKYVLFLGGTFGHGPWCHRVLRHS